VDARIREHDEEARHVRWGRFIVGDSFEVVGKGQECSQFIVHARRPLHHKIADCRYGMEFSHSLLGFSDAPARRQVEEALLD